MPRGGHNHTNHSGLRIGPAHLRLRTEWRRRVTIRLYEEGFNRSEIGALFGVTGNAVTACYSPKKQIRCMPGKLAKEWRARVAHRLLIEGFTVEEIAAVLLMKPASVRKLYFSLPLPLRKTPLKTTRDRKSVEWRARVARRLADEGSSIDEIAALFGVHHVTALRYFKRAA